MFGKLPDLFGRDFAIGFFLPVALFLLSSLHLSSVYAISFLQNLAISADSQVDNLFGTITFALLSWLGATLLLAFNKQIIRVLEGYGKTNPLRLATWLQRRRYRYIHKQIVRLQEQKELGELSALEAIKHINLMREAAIMFPDNESFVLPTSFGNVIRAFEVYPRVMYGFESISGWTRIQLILPEDCQKLIDNAKSLVDFWVNNLLLSVLILIEYLYFSCKTRTFVSSWLPIVALIFCAISYFRSISAAISWGETIKSVFDVYLPKLREKMGFKSFSSPEEQRIVWTKISQAFLYRRAEYWPEWHYKNSAKSEAEELNSD